MCNTSTKRSIVMQSKKLKEPKDITTEQQDLSMLLVKLLFQIHNKFNLHYESDNSSVISASTSDGMHLYDIWQESVPFTDSQTYWIRVQNGKRRLIEFGRHANDGTFFSDQEYNYLRALYNIRGKSQYKKKKASKNPNTDAAYRTLSYLTHKKPQPKPNLKSFEAWTEDRMQVLSYLKQILQSKK